MTELGSERIGCVGAWHLPHWHWRMVNQTTFRLAQSWGSEPEFQTTTKLVSWYEYHKQANPKREETAHPRVKDGCSRVQHCLFEFVGLRQSLAALARVLKRVQGSV
jgi:hypothetical protein